MEGKQFRIGDHLVKILFEGSDNDMSLLPSFTNFRAENSPSNELSQSSATEKSLFTLTVSDTLKPRKEKTLIRKFDTGNGDTIVHLLPDGGYQYIIKDTLNRECCLLICNKNFSECECALNGDWTMRSFGLNDALMLVYAFAGAFHDTILMHASCIGYNGKAYPFTASSGTGKSTHSSLWMKCIEGAELVNDDNPIIRIIDGKPILYGSPWSGKTPCYRNMKLPLGAIVQIKRDTTNHIERLNVVQSLASLLPACSSMKWDEDIFDHLCKTLTTIIETTPIYAMYCLPNEEAAMVCKEGIV